MRFEFAVSGNWTVVVHMVVAFMILLVLPSWRLSRAYWYRLAVAAGCLVCLALDALWMLFGANLWSSLVWHSLVAYWMWWSRSEPTRLSDWIYDSLGVKRDV